MKTKTFGLINKIAFTLAIPIAVMIFFLALSAVKGIAFFENINHINAFVFSAVSTVLVAWALSFNLPSGRFDFSLGALGILSSTIGAKITLSLIAAGVQMNGWAMLIFTLLLGIVLGVISGLVYVVLNLPPIVTSLGLALIYEAFTFIVTSGQGVSINSFLYLTKVNSFTNLIIIAAIVLIVIFVISNYTKFGYEARALASGQIISVHAGIDEKRNAIICYLIAGCLMAISACINLFARGSAQVTLNFSSTPAIFVGFLPMYLGGFIGRYSENKIGILLGAITTATISLGFVRFDIPAPTQSLINALVLLVFLIYLNNETRIKQIILKR